MGERGRSGMERQMIRNGENGNEWMDGDTMAYESWTMPETRKGKGAMGGMRWNGEDDRDRK